MASTGYTQPVRIELDDEATKTLAIGYSSVVVQDDEEGKIKHYGSFQMSRRILNLVRQVLMRLGLYQLDAPDHLSALSAALQHMSLKDMLAIIILDWSRPWDFLDSLHRWFALLNQWSKQRQELLKARDLGSVSMAKAVERHAHND